MRRLARYCIIGIAAIPLHARSAGLSTITAELTCGSVHVKAITVVDKNLDVFGIGVSQKILLTNRKGRYATYLNLRQHKSISVKMNDRKVIDGLAQSWWCFQAKSGLSYIFIDFGCTHDDAKSCSVAMTSPTSGWTNIYDDFGHLLIKNAGEISDAEQADLKARGLWQDFIQPSEAPDETKFIY